jgi:hypothetical protein
VIEHLGIAVSEGYLIEVERGGYRSASDFRATEYAAAVPADVYARGAEILNQPPWRRSRKPDVRVANEGPESRTLESFQRPDNRTLETSEGPVFRERTSSFLDPIKQYQAEEQRSPRVRARATAEEIVLAATDAEADEAVTVVKRIEAEKKPIRDMAAFVRRLATDGELPDWLAQVREARHKADFRTWLAWAEKQPECEHGTRGGNLISPKTGLPHFCAPCRNAQKRTP